MNVKHTALAFVPSFADEKSNVFKNNINPSVESTFVIYKHRRIVDKYIDLKPTKGNLQLLVSALDRTKGGFFELTEPQNE